MIVSRILAVIAAVLFVVAFALAMLLPPLTTLSVAISMVDHGWLVAAQDVIRSRLSDWAWVNLAVPLLVRPAWLLPAELGMVFGGAALTLSRSSGAPRSHRRRS